jgi:hypothetical protein
MHPDREATELVMKDKKEKYARLFPFHFCRLTSGHSRVDSVEVIRRKKELSVNVDRKVVEPFFETTSRIKTYCIFLLPHHTWLQNR